MAIEKELLDQLWLAAIRRNCLAKTGWLTS